MRDQQTTAMLDRPVWSSLTTDQESLSEGNDRARRYQPDVNLFASSKDDSDEALEALAGLLASGDRAYILQVPAIVIPPGLAVLEEALGVQMAFDGDDLPGITIEDLVQLGDSDAGEMLALATLTKPGPFLPRTHKMGTFWGVRIDGRLAAMAGERMRFPGHTEVSGVCTHPDFRGRGLARRLSTHVAKQILARGERPFLHAWATNQAAISLYESLGFRIRAHVNVAIVRG